MWSDASFASVAPVLSSSCVLAAVRSATPGMPVEESAAAPFTDGRWLLSHNGLVDRAVLPVATHLAESTSDSALLAQHVFAAGPAALAQTVLDVASRDPQARLNLLLTNGRHILATTWGDTLSYLVNGDGYVVASEPYDDDPRWVDVPDRHLLELTITGMSLTPLEPRTMTVAIATHLPPESYLDRLREDVRAGLTAVAQVAATQVLLRPARQRALRPDHQAPRVLPDLHGTPDP